MDIGRDPVSVLVVEDDSEVRSYLELLLECRGYVVLLAENGDEALSLLRNGCHGEVSLVLLDVMMPCRDGIDTLREIRLIDANLPVVMLSSSSSSAAIVQAMKCGANDFLTKPVQNEELVATIHRALESRNTVPTFQKTLVAPPQAQPATSLGLSWMAKFDTLLQRVGASDAPVLLNGETGSGKEVLARRLHAASPRANRAFLKVNCAALPSELIESELFGYEKGAFTGAFKSKPGKFDLADRGTILLDEIGDMDFRLQAKLLQVLQDQEFQRVGGTETIRVNVRVMAATHNDLEQSIQDGRFREDLFYRLNVININVPPLRERVPEIAPLAETFMKKYASPGICSPEMGADFRQALSAYHWPGNVRELENFIRKFLVLQDPQAAIQELRQKAQTKSRYSPVTLAAAPPVPTTYSEPIIAPPTLDRVSEAQKRAESEAILGALNRTRWNRKQAATLLGVDYKALLYKMKKLGIDARQVDSVVTQEDEQAELAASA